LGLELDALARRRARRYALVFLLTAGEGLLAAFVFLRSPSMDRNAFLLGLSKGRLLLGGAALSIAAALLCLGVSAAIPARVCRRLQPTLDRRLSSRLGVAIGLTLLWGLFVGAATTVALSTPSIVRYLGNLQPLLTRALPLTIWLLLAAVQAGIFLLSEYRDVFSPSEPAHRWQAVSITWAILLGAWAVVWYLIMHSGLRWEAYPYPLLAPLLSAAMIAFLAAAMLHSMQPDSILGSRLRLPAETLVVFLAVLLVMLASAMAFNVYATPAKAYYPELAEAMLSGRLYLIDPPSTHDLTRFAGRWYVTHPPLVAFLLVPWVAASGLASVNTVLFSSVFASATCALVYVILTKLSALGWSKLRAGSILWLTAFFAFGTVHWWVGIGGRVWYLSQIVPLTFVAAAVLVTLSNGSPFLAGASLAIAMLGRPNLILLLPFLAGIRRQQLGDATRDPERSRPWTRWLLAACVPIAASTLILLWYNWARFGDVLDFGYLTENVGEWLAADLAKYGQFNLHYVGRNLQVMFTSLPRIDPACTWAIRPSTEGMSILLTMPALVFLPRALRRDRWAIGAWVSLAGSLALLLLYYNTGAEQFGYRFFLDVLLPVTGLLALAAGSRVSPALRLAILAGIVVNFLGLLWWYGAWC
jgi:hypothetical protein